MELALAYESRSESPLSRRWELEEKAGGFEELGYGGRVWRIQRRRRVRERKRQQRELDSGTLEIVAESGAVCLSGVVKSQVLGHASLKALFIS